MNTIVRLHVEPRPWTSPCAECAAEIPLDQTVTLANPDRDAVCDDCAQEIDPQAWQALEVLRAIDDGWWAIAKRDGQPGTPAADGANTYLRHVASGIAELAEWYGGAANPTDRSFGPTTTTN
jgi:hypothetical protein